MKPVLIPLLFVGVIAGSGCSGPASEPTPLTVVFFDTATKKPVLGEPSRQTPAPHPVTGKRTLVPAAFCPKCQAWHPVPPVEQIQRSPKAMLCAKTGAKLTLDGPMPTP